MTDLRLSTLTSALIVFTLGCSQPSENDARPPSSTSSTSAAAEQQPAATDEELGGTILGERWSFAIVDGQPQLHIGGRVVPLQRGADDCWMADELHGCWPGPAEIADALLRFHPNFSPLAREPVADHDSGSG